MTWIILAFPSISRTTSALRASSCAVEGYLYLMESAALPPPRWACEDVKGIRLSAAQAATASGRRTERAIERTPVEETALAVTAPISQPDRLRTRLVRE